MATPKDKGKNNSNSKTVAKLTPLQREKQRKQKRLHTDVMSVFKLMGFEYLRTEGKHKVFGGQKGEIDLAFVYENILLLVEETISEADKDHLRTKYFYHEKINQNFQTFIEWLKNDYAEKFSKFSAYDYYDYKCFYIYISSGSINREVKDLFSNFKFIDGNDLKYFIRLSSTLKLTSRLELYKFLNISLEDVGHAQSDNTDRNIDTAIILPESGYGFPKGVQVVTFVMKAQHLMDCAYVLRKDSWDGTKGLYQRLIEKDKIEKIRAFLAEKGRAFINNIIVTLPADATFSEIDQITKLRKQVDIFTIRAVSNLTLTLKHRLNSIGIIDGQHRIFGHYEGHDALEAQIAQLRDRRHLLVTGLYFDEGKFTVAEKRKFESELFLQINNEQKKVDRSLLNYIESLQSPYSPVGLASNVIEGLNDRTPFLNLFFLSQFDKNPIKTPTILQYGVIGVVNPDEPDSSLLKYWHSENSSLFRTSDIAYDEYITFCVSSISTYFNAVKAVFADDWNFKESRLLSVTSIIAFMIAYRKSLTLFDGPQSFDFYKERLNKLDFDFKQKPFPYVSSQWNPLADKIEQSCWK